MRSMSTAPRYLPNYTVSDYQHWKGDWELIDGIPFSMSPSPFGLHERIITRLSFTIRCEIIANDCDCEIYTNLDWIISENSVIRPDLMVVCGEQPDRHLERPPALAVEVLSESTRGRALIAKRSLCRENDVQNYLIIDPVSRSLTLLTPTREAEYGSTDTISLALDASCQAVIECGQLFDR